MDWAEFAAQIPGTKTIRVEPHEGSGGFGDMFGAPVDVALCVIEHTRRRVEVQTQDAAGQMVISPTTVYCPPGTVAPPKSRITLPGSVVTRVLAVSIQDDHGLGLPSHVELLLE